MKIDPPIINKRLKVLHIAPVPPPIGGMATYIYELMHSKLALKTEMRIIRTDFLQKENFSGLVRHFVNLANGLILTLTVLGFILVWWPDIVHIQTNSGLGFFEKSFLALLARCLGRNTLVHVHGGGFRDFYYHSPKIIQRLIRWCGEIPDRIVVASPQMQETWRIIGLSEKRINWINNAVQFPSRGIWDENERNRTIGDGITTPLTVLFLTRIALAKGIIELIEAIGNLSGSYPMLYLRVVGAESKESQIAKDHIYKLGLEDRIKYIGTVSEEQKKNECLAADIYCFPTHVEDQSYAVLEAMSYGLPCIASAVGGVPSIIQNGVNGILISPENVEVLANAIEQLVCDPVLRQQLGINGRKTILEKFTWDQPADEMWNLYISLYTK